MVLQDGFTKGCLPSSKEKGDEYVELKSKVYKYTQLLSVSAVMSQRHYQYRDDYYEELYFLSIRKVE